MSRKILVVEDDDLTRFMMGEMCEALGLDYEIVADGQECLDRLNLGPGDFRLILMDIHMPRLSGLEASEAIRNAPDHPPKHTPIVAVTADTNWHHRDRYEAGGFNSVLPKPVRFESLSEMVQKFAA